MKKPLGLIILVVLISTLATFAFAAEDGDQKAILVTGASSGIGLKITEYLSAAGHYVYAGARKQKDLDSLNKMPNVQSIRLDVTVPAEIEVAVAKITAEGRGLYAVVNNAGVAIYTPVLDTSDEDFHFQMDVNVYGPFRITKAFAPLILESKGRFTTIGSIAGTLSPPGLSAYCMTKHAMEAFNDSFASEMAPQGVTVNIVEPGNYKSKISSSLHNRQVKQLQNSGRELTDEEKEFVASDANDRSQFKEPDEVAAAVMLALFDEHPKARYMVVPNVQEAQMTIGKAMREVVQLNADQVHNFDRAALIEMLDRELAAAGGAE